MDDPNPSMAQWPLSFKMQDLSLAQMRETRPYWSHEIYRGPDNQRVRVLYCNNMAQSEELALRFLNESVVGFDMEWTWWRRKRPNARIQDGIAVIQVACEDKIAIHHVALHRGTTVEDILAPSLRKLIESPDIVKAGVNILGAEVDSLRKWYKLDPRGIFELSHLHKLVTYGESDIHRVDRRVVSLKDQVEQHIGMTINKDKSLSTSDWNRTLSWQQEKYAAADAYASFMLYHCMNAKRAAMVPRPPIPIFAEMYGTMKGKVDMHLQLPGAGGRMVAVPEFYYPSVPVSRHSSGDGDLSEEKLKSHGRRTNMSSLKRHSSSLNVLLDEITSGQLLLILKQHRDVLASSRKCSGFTIAHDNMLQEISQACPRNMQELLQINGMQAKKYERYGATWLSLVRGFIEYNSLAYIYDV